MHLRLRKDVPNAVTTKVIAIFQLQAVLLTFLNSKHLATHARRHTCDEPGCPRKIGFSTINDLERHKKTVHKILGHSRVYHCFGKGCKSDKIWPRLDNFKHHLEKLHPTENTDELIRRLV